MNNDVLAQKGKALFTSPVRFVSVSEGLRVSETSGNYPEGEFQPTSSFERGVVDETAQRAYLDEWGVCSLG
jgi:hypothetical protein